MNTNLQKIKDVVYKSDLSFLEKEELADLFTHAKKDEDLEGIATLVSRNTAMVRLMSNNYQAKMAAFATGDADLWKNILDKEQQMLADYAKHE
jgi:hypothetical protein